MDNNHWTTSTTLPLNLKGLNNPRAAPAPPPGPPPPPPTVKLPPPPIQQPFAQLEQPDAQNIGSKPPSPSSYNTKSSVPPAYQYPFPRPPEPAASEPFKKSDLPLPYYHKYTSVNPTPNSYSNEYLTANASPSGARPGHIKLQDAPEFQGKKTKRKQLAEEDRALSEAFQSSYLDIDAPDEKRRSHSSVGTHDDDEKPKENAVTKIIKYFANTSATMRKFYIIVPILICIWIPGIVGETATKNAQVYSVKLLWWSIWLTVVWGGLWTAMAIARLIPIVLDNVIAAVVVGLKKYVDWLHNLHRYVGLLLWSIACFVSYSPLVRNQALDNNHNSSLTLIGKLLFALLICASVLLGEKLAIQWIASKFNERAFAARWNEQEKAKQTLVQLCRDLYRRKSDEMHDIMDTNEKTAMPMRALQATVKGVKVVAANVGTEIAGFNAHGSDAVEPAIMSIITSEGTVRKLADLLYDHFRADKQRDYLDIEDLRELFPEDETRAEAFELFDRDGNGDATREEVQMACVDYAKEYQSILKSKKDVRSAVSRLDRIFMAVYFVIAVLIIAVSMETQLATLVTGAGAFILGLSWLIGGSLQEVLTSIIFLFIKHPYDDGDRVCIGEDNLNYTVKEIRLLSTVFADSKGCLVQAPNAVLATKFIHNIRRSGQMTETFEFEVAYSTTGKQIEQLTEKMLIFVKSESRDFLPQFEIVLQDIPDQEKWILSACIMYKSNWQQDSLKVRRRNKWIRALKESMDELEIFGSKGNPDADPAPTKYTKVPWEEIQAKKHAEDTRSIANKPSLFTTHSSNDLLITKATPYNVARDDSKRSIKSEKSSTRSEKSSTRSDRSKRHKSSHTRADVLTEPEGTSNSYDHRHASLQQYQARSLQQGHQS